MLKPSRKTLLFGLVVLTFSFAAACRRAPGNSTSANVTPATQSVSKLPPPTGFVNDYAHVIDAEARVRLETSLKKLKEKSKIEFAVVTVETTNGEPIFDYSLAVAKQWGIGPKDTADGGGLLLMLAVKDREWRLQVSRSLEGDLPNEICKELGDRSLPMYKKGDYAGGIEQYVNAIIKRLEHQRNFLVSVSSPN